MFDFLFNFLGAIIWGDLTLVSSGVMVAVGVENLGTDFFSCYLGIIVHDFLLYYMGIGNLSGLLSFSFFKKKLETPDSDKYITSYKSGFYLKTILYKFNTNAYTSFPVKIGKIKENLNKFIPFILILNLIYSTSLFFIFYYICLNILKNESYEETLQMIQSISNGNEEILSQTLKITGAIFSLMLYFVYEAFRRIIVFLFKI